MVKIHKCNICIFKTKSLATLKKHINYHNRPAYIIYDDYGKISKNPIFDALHVCIEIKY